VRTHKGPLHPASHQVFADTKHVKDVLGEMFSRYEKQATTAAS
jgi:hypothetical protein